MLGLPNSADAGGCYYSQYSVTPWGYFPNHTYLSVRSALPYYSLHPPVYYSHVVRRPFGISPYALFPGANYGQIDPATPAVVANPHFSDTAGTAPGPHRTAKAPLRIINPYVVKPGDPGVTPGAVMPEEPKIVRPLTMIRPGQ